jgi:opacity protein-like surface antigen
MTSRSCALCALLVVLLFAAASWAEDTDQTRFYVGVRAGAGILPSSDFPGGVEASTVQPAVGVAVGMNFGSHLGIELSVESWEVDLDIPGPGDPSTGLPSGKIGEYALVAAIPQVRLRYPLLDRRLTPYALAGIGVGFAEFNDRKAPAIGVKIDSKGYSVVGSLGAGIEYFVANNIAVGLETKYVFFRGQDFEIAGRRGKAEVDSLLMLFGLRVYFPEARSRAK